MLLVAAKAVENALATGEGRTQKGFVDRMQTRAELYDVRRLPYTGSIEGSDVFRALVDWPRGDIVLTLDPSRLYFAPRWTSGSPATTNWQRIARDGCASPAAAAGDRRSCTTRAKVPTWRTRSLVRFPRRCRGPRAFAPCESRGRSFSSKAFGWWRPVCPCCGRRISGGPGPTSTSTLTSVAMVATHRDFDGEPWLFWSRFSSPEAKSLARLQAVARSLSHRSSRDDFPVQYQLSGFPTLVRRLLWSWTLNIGGSESRSPQRDLFSHKHCRPGSRDPASPRFSHLQCDVWPDRRERQESGDTGVRPPSDGRPRLIADALVDIEEALNGPIVAELDAIATGQIGETPAQRAA